MIKKSWAKKGELDLISIKKFAIGIVSVLAGFYLLNIESVNALLWQYINDPILLALIPWLLLYVSEELRKDYS